MLPENRIPSHFLLFVCYERLLPPFLPLPLLPPSPCHGHQHSSSSCRRLRWWTPSASRTWLPLKVTLLPSWLVPNALCSRLHLLAAGRDFMASHSAGAHALHQQASAASYSSTTGRARTPRHRHPPHNRTPSPRRRQRSHPAPPRLVCQAPADADGLPRLGAMGAPARCDRPPHPAARPRPTRRWHGRLDGPAPRHGRSAPQRSAYQLVSSPLLITTLRVPSSGC